MTQQAHTRPPAVAGTFYQGDPEQLAAEIAAMLFESSPGLHPAPVRPKALIVPHAGHIYSGPIAARAYALLVPLHAAISRVVMLGPAHRVAVRGVALPDTLAFATPLGRIPLDQDAMRRAQALPQVCVSRAAHAMEHSLEVQLPFLQEMLDDFTLTPLLVGDASAQEVAEVIELLWGGPETLIVISSDLSHYLPYAEAQHKDRATVDRILRLNPLDEFEQACGALPINGMIEVARRRGLRACGADHPGSPVIPARSGARSRRPGCGPRGRDVYASPRGTKPGHRPVRFAKAGAPLRARPIKGWNQE